MCDANQRHDRSVKPPAAGKKKKKKERKDTLVRTKIRYEFKSGVVWPVWPMMG